MPASEDAADKKAAEFVESCLHDMDMPWTDVVGEILSCLTYGWSLHEIVYKRRMGRKRDPRLESKFDDGLIGWQKLPIRSQESLYKWEFDDCDNLTALEHSARKKIPRECARNFSAGSDLFELVAVSKRKIFSEVREVVQVLVVGDKFLGGVACLNQDIHVAEDVGDF